MGTVLWFLSAAGPGLAQNGANQSRFLEVKGWQGGFTVTGTASGTVAGFLGPVAYQISESTTGSILADRYDPSLGGWTGTVTGTSTVSEKITQPLGNCQLINTRTATSTIQTQSLLPGPRLSFLTLDLGIGTDTWSFWFSDPYIMADNEGKLVCPEGTTVVNQSKQTYFWSPLGRTMGLAFPTAGFALTGRLTMPAQLNLPGADPFGASPIMNREVTWNFNPIDVDELVVEVTAAKYDTWMPAAGRNGEPGDGLEFTAELKNRDGSTPNVRATRFLWELTDVSREPGIAINWPSSGAPGSEPDLRFEVQPPQFSMSPETITVETRPGTYLTDKAVILPCDWGAWGVLKVTAEFDGRPPVTGKLKDTGDSDIRLPKRSATSFIADRWKQEQGISAPDGDDGEGDPVGDGNQGDGLSLYEEYRGFYENGVHKSAHPKKKDYFIRNRAGAGALGGIAQYRIAAGLDVNFELQEDEFDGARVINFLHDRGPHLVDQHVVIVSVNAGLADYAEAVGAEHHPDTPKNILYVQLPPVWPTGRRTAVPAVSYQDVSLAHELLHASNVYHHGEGGVTEATWTRDPSTGAILEDGLPIIPKLETGELMAARLNLPDLFGIGIKYGAHSGDDTCVMRYDNATAYVSDTRPEVRYLAREVAGVSLCSNPKGTGVNDVDHVPQSRYGDALRGDCKHQILVNDRVPAPLR